MQDWLRALIAKTENANAPIFLVWKGLVIKITHQFQNLLHVADYSG